MDTKKCFKCKERKPLHEFYRHKRMADGHLNKCKSCTKKDMHEHRQNNLERIREYDRNRPNMKERLARNKDNYRKRISTPEGRAAEWEKKKKYYNSTKRSANLIAGNAIRDGVLVRPEKCSACGKHTHVDAHHENYYKPLDVIWLCKPCHGKRHKEINEMLRNGADLTHLGFGNKDA